MTFDRPLQPGALDFLNWDIRVAAVDWVVMTAVAAGNKIMGTSSEGSEDPGAPGLTFSPPPFDVLSSPGIPAAAFADFPLAVT